MGDDEPKESAPNRKPRRGRQVQVLGRANIRPHSVGKPGVLVKTTKFDLKERIKPYHNEKQNNILIEFDAFKFNVNQFNLIQQLPDIIKDSGEIGSFQLDIFTVQIIQISEYQNNLINL